MRSIYENLMLALRTVRSVHTTPSYSCQKLIINRFAMFRSQTFFSICWQIVAAQLNIHILKLPWETHAASSNIWAATSEQHHHLHRTQQAATSRQQSSVHYRCLLVNFMFCKNTKKEERNVWVCRLIITWWSLAGLCNHYHKIQL